MVQVAGMVKAVVKPKGNQAQPSHTMRMIPRVQAHPDAGAPYRVRS